MKRILILSLSLLLVAVAGSSLFAQSTLEEVWRVSAGTKNWFTTSTTVRGLGYNPVTNRIYVASRDVNDVIILDAATGDSVGNLDMTGISGGVYAFSKIAVTKDGRLYTTNLVTTVTKAAPLKIYTWANDASAPVLAFSDSVLGPRVGDALSVLATGANTLVYVSGNASPGAVHLFQRHASNVDSLVWVKTVTPSGWASGVLSVAPVDSSTTSNFWVNTTGKPARSFDTNGQPVDTIPTGVLATSAASVGYFEFFGNKFLSAYAGNVSPHVARLIDIQNGGLQSAVLGITPSLGTTVNSAGPGGEIIFDGADTSIYVLSPNNAVGKFRFRSAMATSLASTRDPFVPNNDEADTVNFIIRSLKPITSASVRYYGVSTAVSDQAGTDSADVALTLVSGSDLNGTYNGVVPGSVNRNGRRVEFVVTANDGQGITSVSPMIKGYFAGLTKLALMNGPRHVDTNGVLVYSGYGIKSKAIVTVEDSVYQTFNNEIVLQDDMGGVTVFKSGTTLDVKQGNAYTVTGTTSQFNGKFQFVQPGLDFVDMGPTPGVAPRVVTIKELIEKGEELENTLVEIRGVMKTPGSVAWPAANSDANMMVVDASGDSTTMRVDRDTELSGTPEPRYPVTIVGVAGQFDNSNPYTSGYQWLPRGMYDFIGLLSARMKDTTKALINTEVDIPVLVGDVNGLGITSYQFTAQFDSTALQFMGAANIGSISAGYTFSTNVVRNGLVQIAGSGTEPLKDSGAIFNFKFKVLQPSTSTIILTGQFNEGNPHAMVMGGVVVGNVPIVSREIVAVKNSKFTAGITNVGHIGALNGYQDQVGFMFNSINTLYEGSLIMGNAKNKVPNAARFPAAPSWNPGFRHRTPIMINKVGSRIETMTAFDDSSYSSPLGIWVSQMTALDTAVGKEGYLILGYKVVNKTASVINNFRLGSFFDFDLTAAGDADRGGILKDSSNQIPGVNSGNPFKIHLAYMYNGTTFTGVVPLSQTVFAGGRIASGAAEVYSGKMVDSNKYTYISTFRAANTYGDVGAADDHSIFSSVGPYTIAANDTAKGAFGLVVGNSLNELLNNARAAQKAAVQEYGMTIQILTSVDGTPEQMPTEFALNQNYPNPFNPATTIRFALPSEASVTLKVYDMLGREIRSLVNTKMNAGFHEVQWNGRNSLGSQVASGMYIYRIEAGSFVSTKKMMMLK